MKPPHFSHSYASGPIMGGMIEAALTDATPMKEFPNVDPDTRR
jgi:hypothetical protein